MTKQFFALVLLALVPPAYSACVVRISDLQYSPTPPNPIRVAGRVTSVSPLKLSDGQGDVTVAGVEAELSDFLVVTGDWDGSVLTVSGDVTTYVGPAATEMVYIPAGSFLMGNNDIEPDSVASEFPQHVVYLTPYRFGRYEVTRGEYRRFIEADGYSNSVYWSSAGWNWVVSNNRTQPRYWASVQQWWNNQPFTQTDSHPVVGVTYYEAQAYCAWAGGHLPKEAQWEKAARWTGTYPDVYPWGNVWDREKCNNLYDHNVAGGGYLSGRTAPVGSYPSGASPYGLQDMAGNVWEWCADWYAPSYYSKSPSFEPVGPATGSYRVLRGGSWNSNDFDIRCAFRNNYSPDYTWYNVGFRFAR